MPRRLVRRPLFRKRLPRRSNRRSKRPVFVLLSVVVLIVLILVWADGKVRPMVGQLAVARVHVLASQMINDAISETVISQGIRYSDLIYFEKDSNGNITALKTDMAQINALKSNVIRSVNARLTDMKTTDIRIPLGSALNAELLSGRGPRIPIHLAPYAVADASFENSFTTAGINQTRHQILMDITVNIGVLLPGSSTATEVTVQVCVAETVIVGRVPDSYAHLDPDVFSPSGARGSVSEMP